ncbi:MAG: ABC transporter ATP-binding protein [Alkalispirochaetaceae bacterium]
MNGAVLRGERIFKAYGFSRQVLRGLEVSLYPGEVLVLLGESGAGKSTLARILAGLERPDAGFVRRAPRLPKLGVQMLFQDPFSALNPRRSVEESVGEAIPLRKRRKRVASLLSEVGIDANRAQEYPGSFSGGQLQRINLARALSVDPEVLILDEPVSSLDLSVQARILDLIEGERRERKLSVLFITHDVDVAAHVADRIAVMKEGVIVEEGEAERVLREPRSEYGRSLFGHLHLGGIV